MVTVFVTLPLALPSRVDSAGCSKQGRERRSRCGCGRLGLAIVSQGHLANIQWALLYGVVLTKCRGRGRVWCGVSGIGQYPRETNTLPLHVEAAVSGLQRRGGLYPSASLLARYRFADSCLVNKLCRSGASPASAPRYL